MFRKTVAVSDVLTAGGWTLNHHRPHCMTWRPQ